MRERKTASAYRYEKQGKFGKSWLGTLIVYLFFRKRGIRRRVVLSTNSLWALARSPVPYTHDSNTLFKRIIHQQWLWPYSKLQERSASGRSEGYQEQFRESGSTILICVIKSSLGWKKCVNHLTSLQFRYFNGTTRANKNTELDSDFLTRTEDRLVSTDWWLTNRM